MTHATMLDWEARSFSVDHCNSLSNITVDDKYKRIFKVFLVGLASAFSWRRDWQQAATIEEEGAPDNTGAAAW